MQIDEFKNELTKLNIDFNENILSKLEIYYEYLIEYNSHTNLTTITEEHDVYLKHFYDSLTICKVVDLKSIESVIDIGTGAGFPGAILKIFYPHLKVTLLDSNNKKTTFLKNLIEKLKLDNVTIVNNRAEEYAKKHLNEYDLCVSRAVAFIDIILELSLPFIKQNGMVVLMKGNIDNEKSILENHYQELNVSSFGIKTFNLPISLAERNLIMVKKRNMTSKILSFNQILKRNEKWREK